MAWLGNHGLSMPQTLARRYRAVVHPTPPTRRSPASGVALGLGLSVVAVGCVLASYVVASFAPLAVAGGAALLVLSVRRPATMLMLAAVMAPFEGLQVRVGPGGLSPTEASFLLVAVGYLIRAATGLPQVRPSRRDWPVVVLVLSLLPSLALGTPWIDVAKLLVMWTAFYLVFLAVQSLPPAQVRRLLVALSLGAAVLGARAIVGYVQHGGAQLADGTVDTASRASSGITDPNYFAAYLLLAGVPALALALLTRTRGRLLLAAAPLVVGVAVVLSLSRGGLVGLLLAVAVLLAAVWARSSNRTRSRLALLGATAVAAVVVGAVPLVGGATVQTVIERFGQASSTSVDNNRLQLYSASTEVFEQHPVVGVGIAQFSQQAPTRRVTEGGVPLTSAHSVPLNLAAEQGLLGLLSFLAWIIRIVADLRGGLRRRSTQVVSVGLSASLLGYLVQSLTVTSYQVEIIQATFFLLAGVAAGLRRWRLEGSGALYSNERRQPERAASAPDPAVRRAPQR